MYYDSVQFANDSKLPGRLAKKLPERLPETLPMSQLNGEEAVRSSSEGALRCFSAGAPREALRSALSAARMMTRWLRMSYMNDMHKLNDVNDMTVFVYIYIYVLLFLICLFKYRNELS